MRNDWSLRQLLVKRDTEDEINKEKNICNKKLPDISQPSLRATGVKWVNKLQAVTIKF